MADAALSTIITPQFVLSYTLPPTVSDYRYVVNATGDAVIVERYILEAGGNGKPQLYIVELAGGGSPPTPFLKMIDAIAIGETTRPDWSWVTGQVAFNFTDSPRIGVVDGSGANPGLFWNTTTMYYPTWSPDGQTLATKSGQDAPKPNTTTIDSKTGKILAKHLEGDPLFGGMPSVNPANPNLIVFAGQPVGEQGYDQDMNYIWIKDLSGADHAVPLEYNAPPREDGYCPAVQGRAPWGSPDGK